MLVTLAQGVFDDSIDFKLNTHGLMGLYGSDTVSIFVWVGGAFAVLAAAVLAVVFFHVIGLRLVRRMILVLCKGLDDVQLDKEFHRWKRRQGWRMAKRRGWDHAKLRAHWYEKHGDSKRERLIEARGFGNYRGKLRIDG